jgi:hypothetical protein
VGREREGRTKGVRGFKREGKGKEEDKEGRGEVGGTGDTRREGARGGK